VPIALPQERQHEHGGDEELKQRATQEHEELAAEAEDEVPCLVDREVEAVEPSVGTGCPETLPTVDGQDQRERDPAAPLPHRVRGRGSQITSEDSARVRSGSPPHGTRAGRPD
jgi:hypothetical protein